MHRTLTLSPLFLASAVALAADAVPSGNVRIEPLGEFIHEINLPGERRSDDVVPGQTACLRVSQDRWLVLCNTRGFRGVDDERSVVYQLRSGGPDGTLLKEGFLSRAIEDWDPLGRGEKRIRQHGHVVGYGVPKGAFIDGREALNANLFVVHWRVVGIPYDAARKQIARTTKEDREESAGVEWVQFRLNDQESDIEILQAPTRLRQVGFASGAKFCDLDIASMNQSFVPPIPANAACTEWFCCNHFDGDRIAILKLSFDPESRRYRWTANGPLAGGKDAPIFEGNIVRAGDEWIISARSRIRGTAWTRTTDPMTSLPTPKVGKEPPSNSPIETYRCADGVLRLFTGDPEASPYKRGRDPLYVWDVNPRDFACTQRRVIFDTVEAKMPFRKEAQAKVDFATLFPAQGSTQIVSYRVNVRSNNFGYPGRTDIPQITAEEKAKCGAYFTKLHYPDVRLEPWTFQAK